MGTENLKRAVEVDGTTYDVELESAEEGGFVIHVPQLNGCVSQGENVEDALNMIKDAIRAWRASAEAHGE